jgi:hypothetical protein
MLPLSRFKKVTQCIERGYVFFQLNSHVHNAYQQMIANSPVFRLTSLLLFCTLTAFFISCSSAGEDNNPEQQIAAGAEEPHLVELMSALQRYTHKLSLSVAAENGELADFYLHELEETTVEIIEDVPEYEGHKIAELTESMLQPALEPVDEAIDSERYEAARERVEQMVTSCNNCHAATDHGFIEVTPGFEENPYNQNFDTGG